MMLRPQVVPNLRHGSRVFAFTKSSQSQFRSISSTPLYNFRSRCSGDRQHTLVLKPPWSAHPNLSVYRNHAFSRSASTTTRAPPIAEVTSSYPSTASPLLPDASRPIESTLLEETNFSETPSYFDSILDDEPPQVHEYIGFLKDMGLDYGWGTTTLIETILEHVRIYTELPWWAAISLTVIGIRLSLFKLYINAQDATARQAAIKPLSESIRKRTDVAQAAKDPQAMRALWAERMQLNRKYGIRTMTLFWPLIFQLPLGFGTFRLMRGMAALPVPGFDQGGFLWLADLTTPDPFYILPLATAATYFFTFKLGGETGGAASNLSPATYRLMCYGLPFMTGTFAMWWPVGLQIPIFINGLLAISQNILFRQSWFRRMVGIQPLGVMRTAQGPTKINRGPDPSKAAPQGIISTVRKFYSDTVDEGKKIATKRAQRNAKTDAESKKARAYGEKVARETARRRFEAKQAKEAREEARRHRSILS